TLGEDDPTLRDTILSFRDDEISHRDLAIAQGAEESPGYDLIRAVVKNGSRVALWLLTRLCIAPHVTEQGSRLRQSRRAPARAPEPPDIHRGAHRYERWRTAE